MNRSTKTIAGQKRHEPGTIYHENDDGGDRFSKCVTCNLDIESWEMHDDELGWYWTDWGLRVDKGEERFELIKGCPR